MSLATATGTSSAAILASIPARVRGALAGDLKAGARLLIRERRRLALQISRLLGDAVAFNCSIDIQIALLDAAIAGERAAMRERPFFGRPIGDVNRLIALKQAAIALRYLRRFPGAV